MYTVTRLKPENGTMNHVAVLLNAMINYSMLREKFSSMVSGRVVIIILKMLSKPKDQVPSLYQL